MKRLAVPCVRIVRTAGRPAFIGIGTRVSARSRFDVVVHTDQRRQSIAWPLAASTLHCRSNALLAVGGGHPPLAAMRLDGCFSTRADVLSLARSPMLEFGTTLFSSLRVTSARAPWEVWNKPRQSVWPPCSPSTNPRPTAGAPRCLRFITASKSLFHQLHRAPYGEPWMRWSPIRSMSPVTPPFPSFRHIGLQQFMRVLQQPLRAGPFPFRITHCELFAFLATQPHNIFAYRNVPRRHDGLHRCSIERETGDLVLK